MNTFYHPFILTAAILCSTWISVRSAAAAADIGAPESQASLRISIGTGLLIAPEFLGAKTYKVMVLPDVRLTYGDRISASIGEGIRYRLVQDGGWAAGPIARIAFPRNEDGSTQFQLAGVRSTALRGMGDVETTVETGLFVRKSWGDWSAGAELRRGLNGHQGLVGDLSIDYGWRIPRDYYAGRPTLLNLGLRSSFVDTAYNTAYFGINVGQSARSGLPQYRASGGLLSYGAGAALIAPLTRQVTLTAIANYTRLAGPSANSPLILMRGARDMVTFGTFLSYTFGRGA